MPAYCRWFFILLPLALTTQVAEELVIVEKIKKCFIFHIYQPLEFALICGLYFSMFNTAIFKKFTLVCLFFYCVLTGLYYYTNPGSFFEMQFIDFCIEALLVCLLVIMLFVQILQVKHKVVLKKDTAFWLNAVHLIFYGGCLFVMGCYYYLNNTDPMLAKQFLKINYVLNLVLYAGYVTIFVCTTTPKTLSL